MSVDSGSGSGSADLSVRAMEIEQQEKRNLKRRDRDDDDVVATCSSEKKSRSEPSAAPTVQFQPGVILFDRRYAVRFAAANPPPPTAGVLLAGVVAAGAVYPGNGTISLIAGDAEFFTDANCTIAFVDPNDGGALTQAHPVQIPNASFPNIILYVRAHTAGPLTVQLALDNVANWQIAPPDADTAAVVQLTLEASPFAPNNPARLLTDAQKIVYGKYAGVPVANALSLRAPICIRAGNPQGHGLLVLRNAAGISVHTDEFGDGVAPDLLTVPQNDADQDLWIQGTQAGAAVWLSLGLQLADGTLLDHGDLLKVIPVAQGQISVGFEWETTPLLVERHHDTNVKRQAAQFEGLPSKAIVFRAAAAAMQIDTEVSSGAEAETYAEMVIGPAYDYGELEAQLLEIYRVERAVRTYNPLYVRTPADIASREAGHFHEIWMPANHRVALVKKEGNLRGTAQSTFAVPLWMLSTFLYNLAGAEGQRAKEVADAFASATADDLVNHANRDADDLVTGLIAACQYYIEVFRIRAHIADDDGPKTALPVMFRTDFHAMYSLLQTAGQQNAFAAWAAAHPHAGSALIPNGHKYGQAGPTIANWLASVIQPPVDPQLVLPDGSVYAPHVSATQKDLLSPPPGMPRHATNGPIQYGMGKMKTDTTTGNVIAECRAAMGGSGNTGLPTFVENAFKFADCCLLGGIRTWVDLPLYRWGPPAHQGNFVAVVVDQDNVLAP
ncbi:MAG: hypothetical protein QOI58_318 [Thermoanaerobaculia bacterium]|nr:hypothetical protein [Thermoanaerobaculia bacterium]